MHSDSPSERFWGENRVQIGWKEPAPCALEGCDGSNPPTGLKWGLWFCITNSRRPDAERREGLLSHPIKLLYGKQDELTCGKSTHQHINCFVTTRMYNICTQAACTPPGNDVIFSLKCLFIIFFSSRA